MTQVNEKVSRLVKLSLAFHNLNKKVETKLGLSLVQYHLLSYLKDMPGVSPQELAKVMGMHASTLTQSMKRMSRKEFLFIGTDPKDSRRKLLTLTLPGKKAVDQFRAGIEEFLSEDLFS